MNIEQAKAEMENIKDLVKNNIELTHEIEDNNKGIKTSLKYIENQLKKKRR